MLHKLLESMKIVLSGGPSIGKTTLINHIKDELGFRVIPDYMDVVLAEQGLKRPKEMDDESARKIRIESLLRKVNAESISENFISDKGVVDYFAYWLAYTSNSATDEENDSFKETVLSHCNIYDLIIIPPIGRFEIKDNSIRLINPEHQLRIHALIKGLYSEFEIPWIEYTLDLNDKSNKVLKDLKII